jgi:hypothetical protein
MCDLNFCVQVVYEILCSARSSGTHSSPSGASGQVSSHTFQSFSFLVSKEFGQQMDILQDYKIKSGLFVHAQMVYKFLPVFLERKRIIKIIAKAALSEQIFESQAAFEKKEKDC